MSSSHRQQQNRAQSWGFSLTVIGLVGYFAVANPEALSPVWVTVIGLLLTAAKTVLGMKLDDAEEKEVEDEREERENSAGAGGEAAEGTTNAGS